MLPNNLEFLYIMFGCFKLGAVIVPLNTALSTEEVEDILNAHPDIAESAIIPVPGRVRNEEIKAFIILKPGRELNPEMIVAYCSERLAEFKVPRYIEFVDSFPKTAKITIKKHELRNMKQDHTVGCFDRLRS